MRNKTPSGRSKYTRRLSGRDSPSFTGSAARRLSTAWAAAAIARRRAESASSHISASSVRAVSLQRTVIPDFPNRPAPQPLCTWAPPNGDLTLLPKAVAALFQYEREPSAEIARQLVRSHRRIQRVAKDRVRGSAASRLIRSWSFKAPRLLSAKCLKGLTCIVA